MMERVRGDGIMAAMALGDSASLLSHTLLMSFILLQINKFINI